MNRCLGSYFVLDPLAQVTKHLDVLQGDQEATVGDAVSSFFAGTWNKLMSFVASDGRGGVDGGRIMRGGGGGGGGGSGGGDRSANQGYGVGAPAPADTSAAGQGGKGGYQLDW